ncbi:hypothetical protein GFC01_07270 [Desulfofundulus thermobenzoicus]|uniref:Uncharacterized protein n=1 Tax=Desulfofundulus thermobenzoicus TaxID=29376 RepID=A0A6N7IQ76_9FIRM|nr:hypothetical protein [Desulfofundulus thermobenzoicus]MQL52071.1 hypothetical protein [Desulfofundulus thermobenzoicus]HHW43924.1 hypothetical protein [Desulfotomaculum sp.]
MDRKISLGILAVLVLVVLFVLALLHTPVPTTSASGNVATWEYVHYREWPGSYHLYLRSYNVKM